MNRMFRFNIRKSHHRVDSMMGSTFATTRKDRNSDDIAHQEQPHSPGFSGKRKKNSSKQRSLNTIQGPKKDSISSGTCLRLIQSEKSFEVNNFVDTSETELTVPHVDSSFSQNSDAENTAATGTKVFISNDSSNDTTDCYSLSDSRDDIDKEEIPFLGNVFEYVDDDDSAKNDDIGIDPIVLLAIQASKKVLDDASDPHNVNFTTDAVSDRNMSAPSLGKKRMEQFYLTLDQEGNALVEEGDPAQAVIKYLQALRYKHEALLSMYPNSTGNTINQRPLEEQRRVEQKQHVLASIATSINNLAFLQHNRSRIGADETLILYQTALQIKRHVLGSQHLSVGKTLNNIGSIQYMKQEFLMAAQTYEEARTILQLHLGSHHLDVCTVTSNIGDVHCSMKQWTLAAKEYRTALELRWPLYGPSDPKNMRLIEQIAEIEMLVNQMNAQKEDLDRSSNHEKCYGPIIKDVRKLHKEVQRDIDHIDRQLSSQLPLQMMKEKITVYREIRDIMMNDRNDDHRLKDDGEDSCNSKNANKQISEVTGNGKKSIPTSRGSAVETKKLAKSIDIVHVSETNHITTPTSTKKATIGLRYTPGATPKKSSSPQLTSEERQKALLSVKEKLAKLRANRESISSLPLKVITDFQ